MKTVPDPLSNIRQEFSEHPRGLYYWNLESAVTNKPIDTALLGMEVTQIRDPVHANETLRSNVSAVMLVQFPKCADDSTLDLIEQLISECQHCIWIALLPKQWLHQ